MEKENFMVIVGDDTIPSPIKSQVMSFSLIENTRMMEEIIMDLMQTLHQRNQDSDMDEFQGLLKRSPEHYKLLRRILDDNNYVKRKQKDDFLVRE